MNLPGIVWETALHAPEPLCHPTNPTVVRSTMTADFDAGTYGRSFADVYDLWYPSDDDTTGTIDYLVGLSSPAARILEVGVGTGRLAIPLALFGHEVVGIDSSEEMLGLLATKATTAGVAIHAVLGDASAVEAWPTERFDLVVAAFNFVFNLIGDDAKQSFLDHAGRSLSDQGQLVVESYVPISSSDEPRRGDDPGARATNPTAERHVELKEISFDSVVLIASETDHTTGTVIGQHIELRDGEPVRLRPWRVHVVTPQHLDVLANRAGLELVGRSGSWDGTPFDSDSHRAISVYRRSQPDTGI